jgi:hypothetical protein
MLDTFRSFQQKRIEVEARIFETNRAEAVNLGLLSLFIAFSRNLDSCKRTKSSRFKKRLAAVSLSSSAYSKFLLLSG